MNGQKAREARQARVEQGLDPFADPVHNFLPEEAEDTRRDRRTKKFRKRRHELELQESNPRQRMAEIARWNRAYTATAQAKAEKQMLAAAEKALAEMEVEEIPDPALAV